MPDEFSDCLEKRKLIRQDLGAAASNSELAEAGKDLASAEKSLLDKDWKWATVQAYYSMFHSAKALVLRRGYREKSHYCLLIALRKLLVETGRLEARYSDAFENAMLARQDADYGATYSAESAKAAVGDARDFLSEARTLAGK